MLEIKYKSNGTKYHIELPRGKREQEARERDIVADPQLWPSQEQKTKLTGGLDYYDGEHPETVAIIRHRKRGF